MRKLEKDNTFCCSIINPDDKFKILKENKTVVFDIYIGDRNSTPKKVLVQSSYDLFNGSMLAYSMKSVQGFDYDIFISKKLFEDEDVLKFTLWHEIGHIVNGDCDMRREKDAIKSFIKMMIGILPAEEKDADAFALAEFMRADKMAKSRCLKSLSKALEIANIHTITAKRLARKRAKHLKRCYR